MAPSYSILLCPDIPGLDYMPNNDDRTWDHAPQSEYLQNLTQHQQRLYEQLCAQNWTHEQCYFYFTNLDVFTGFRREFLRYKGWSEGEIEEWDRECQRTNPLPDLTEVLDSTQRKRAVIKEIMKEGTRRRDIAEDMAQGIEEPR